MIPHYPLFINGEFVKTQNKQDIINPSSGEIIATVSIAGKNEIEDAIRSARNSFDRGLWRKLSLSDRKKYIIKISAGILEKAQELSTLESLNSGKPVKETTFMDIPSAAAVFDYFANNLERFLKEETIQIKSQIANAEANLLREPWGVCALIIPWNYRF